MFKKICILASLSQQTAIAIPKHDGSFGESVNYELAVAKYFGKPRGVYHPM